MVARGRPRVGFFQIGRSMRTSPRKTEPDPSRRERAHSVRHGTRRAACAPVTRANRGGRLSRFRRSRKAKTPAALAPRAAMRERWLSRLAPKKQQVKPWTTFAREAKRPSREVERDRRPSGEGGSGRVARRHRSTPPIYRIEARHRPLRSKAKSIRCRVRPREVSSRPSGNRPRANAHRVQDCR